MADLQTKYQKLAAEFAKLRSQVPVLKKAVLDEQAKEKECKETLKEREQALRRLEQENESLTFRNSQLTTRISVLQEELDTVQLQSKKHKKKDAVLPQNSRPDSSVVSEELQSKIEENARLHKQVYEAKQQHEETVGKLQDRLSQLEEETTQHQSVLNATVQRSQSQLEKLQEERVMVEVKLQKIEKEYRDVKSRSEAAEAEANAIQDDLGGKLAEAMRVIEDKLQFNDGKIQELNSLNIPSYNRKHQLRAKELVSQACGLLKELIQGLSNFHTYCEQRTRIYPVDCDKEPMSDINKKFCQYLHDNVSYLRPVEASFRNFLDALKEEAITTLETATGLQEFAEKFRCYVAYMKKLLPYQLLSIEEECNISSCTSTLEAKNMELHKSMQKFTASLAKVETYVSLLGAQSSSTCPHLKTNHAKIFGLMSQALAEFHDSTREVSKHYNAKVSLEHQLPTATNKLRTTDECIVASLVSLVTCTSKFSAFFAGNLDFFQEPATYCCHGGGGSPVHKAHPAVALYRQSAASYLTSINRPSSGSVPYKIAAKNRKTLASSTENKESLALQVNSFQERISKLEQDKEHWLLECKLLQMKYEKELKRANTLEAHVSGKVVNSMSPAYSQTKNDSPSDRDQIETSLLGRLETSPVPDSDADTREDLIKSHFSHRIGELTSRLQMVDSKASNFHAECRALHKRLKLCQQDKEKLSEDLQNATQTISQLKDELQMTTKSYEGQLSMMSEHLAAMNEKLTTQKDEIEHLKYQMQNSKTGKRGKPK